MAEQSDAQEILVGALHQRLRLAMARGDWSQAEDLADQARAAFRGPGGIEEIGVWIAQARLAAHRGHMGQMANFQEILRRLAIVDESAVEEHAGLRLGLPKAHVLDEKTAELVRVAAVAATGAPEVCLEWSVTRALAATEEEITGVLLAIAQ